MQTPVDLKPHFLTFDDLDGRIDWARFFGNANPVELDVGCGRGLFLVNAGLTHPDVNYLGLELDYHEGRRAARRLHKRAMPNARVLGGDVRIALNRYIPPRSVQAIHVYFPDPWWKRKHKRRRIFTDEFVSQMAASLAPGGLVHSWTDVGEYFAVISALMDHDARFEPLPAPPERAPKHDLDFQTSFERKKRHAGETIWRGCWRLATGDERPARTRKAR
jgi:tRNA (guanine-N7-)-methyltransferase